MIEKIMDFFRGYLIIEIRGNALERFITQIIESGINLENVERLKKDYYRAKIYAGDFNRLRPLVRKRLCTVRILKKKGIKFILAKLKKRFLLVLGLTFFICVLWLASSFLWFISIEGLDKIPEAKIYFILAKNNAQRGVLKNSIDLNVLEKSLLKEEPGIAWVNLKWQGTRLYVEIVEKKVVKKTEASDIIAKNDGIINEIIVMKGRAVVEEGDTVTKGQTLIVGLADDRGEKSRARGIVKADTWHEASGEVKLQCEQALYTGESSKSLVIRVGSKSLRVLSPPSYSKYTISRTRKRVLKGRNYKFPIEFIIEEYKEVKYFKYARKKEVALFMARERAINNILTKLDSNSVIIDVKSEVKSIKDGIVKVRVLMKTEENIAVYP